MKISNKRLNAILQMKPIYAWQIERKELAIDLKEAREKIVELEKMVSVDGIVEHSKPLEVK